MLRTCLMSAVLASGVLGQAMFNWDCTKAATTCNNACYAANRGAPTTLTYDSNMSARGPRRTASGCNRTPCSNQNLPYRNSGSSCDEYPFASTFEGGTGATLRCTDPNDQNSEGGQLGNFYKTIASGTRFIVTIENDANIQFCDRPSDPNDGFEFKLVNGQFQNFGRRSPAAEPRFKNDDAPAINGIIWPRVEMEDGSALTVLGFLDDEAASFEGRSVFKDGTYKKIVRRLN